MKIPNVGMQSRFRRTKREAGSRGNFRFVTRVSLFFRSSGLAALSQAAGLLQYVLLVAATGANSHTDAFFFINAWVLFPSQVILFGWLYPRWLRARIGLHLSDRNWIYLSALLSLFFGFGAAAILVVFRGNDNSAWLYAGLLGLNGIVQSFTTAAALYISSSGHAEWLASVSLFASLIACFALLMAALFDLDKTMFMCAGLIAGNGIFLLLLIMRREQLRVLISSSPISEHHPILGRSDSAWFLTKSAAGYGAALVLQTAAAALPLSSLTVLGLISKVVSGFGSILTNALLPRFVHRNSTNDYSASAYLWVVATGSLMIAFPVSYIAAQFNPAWSSYSLTGLAWAVSASLNAVSQRVASKFLPARIALSSIVVSFALPAVFLLGSVVSPLGLSDVLRAYVLLDLVAGILFTIFLRRYCLAAFTAVVTIALLWGATL